MKWISVNERMPDDRQIVLIGFFHDDFANYQENKHADCFVQLGRISKNIYDNTFNTWSLAGAPSNNHVSIWNDVQPTHWMILPEPPKD